MTLTVKTLALGMLALALGGVAACAPEKPAAPTYTKDVGPILDAHCSRCHSAHGPGGAFQGDPGANPPLPLACHLDFYEGDPAKCTADPDGGAPPASCNGARFCAMTFGTVMKLYIRGQSMPMPPPPATLMNDWEADVVEAWLKNPVQ
jgi:hypothetical protein